MASIASKAVSADLAVKLLLCGFLNARATAESLHLQISSLEEILANHGLHDTAMVPYHVDRYLNTTFIDLGRSSFALPCFDDDIQFSLLKKRRTEPLTFSLRPGEILNSRPAAASNGVHGIIGHVGRCGSTLLCNLLAATGGWITVKEPEIINALMLRLANKPDERARETASKLIAKTLQSFAHGTQRDVGEVARDCIVKLTSWNLLFAHEFLPHLSDTPIVILTRDPCETVASSLDQLPGWVTQGSSSTDIPDRIRMAQFFAAEWSLIVEAALCLPGRLLFVHYENLIENPIIVLDRIIRHFGHFKGIPLAANTSEVMQRYSKGSVYETFEPQGKHGRISLEQEVRDLVSSITDQSLAKLRRRLKLDSDK